MPDIPNLPSDDKNYLILWTGNCVRNAEREFLIEVKLTDLKASKLNDENLIIQYTSRVKEPFRVPVKYLPLLKQGVVVKNGNVVLPSIFRQYELELEDTFGYEPQELSTFVGNNLLREYKLEGSILNSYYINLPDERFRIRQRNQNHFLDEIDSLLISCHEIARFYFFKSDNLTEAIYGHPVYDKRDFCDPDKSEYLEAHTGTPTIVLKRNMLLSDGPAIYRMAFDENAKFQLQYIKKNFIKDGYENGSARLKCVIPYESRIRLLVSGFVMDINDPLIGSKKIFVVSQIQGHHNQWSFKDLRILKEIGSSKSEPKSNSGYLVTNEGGRSFSVNSVENRGKREYIQDTTEQELNFDSIKVKIGYIESETAISTSNDELEVDEYIFLSETTSLNQKEEALGEIKVNKNKVLRKQEPEDVLEQFLQDFIDAIYRCGNNYSLKIEFRGLNHNCLIDHFPEECFVKGKPSYPWVYCLFNWEKKQWENRRKFVLAEINYRDRYHYFLRVRPQGNRHDVSLRHIQTVNSKRLNQSEIKLLLYSVANGKGNLAPDFPCRNFVESFNGRKISVDTEINEYARKIFNVIRNTLGDSH